jgi:hypothetical protein
VGDQRPEPLAKPPLLLSHCVSLRVATYPVSSILPGRRAARASDAR